MFVIREKGNETLKHFLKKCVVVHVCNESSQCTVGYEYRTESTSKKLFLTTGRIETKENAVGCNVQMEMVVVKKIEIPLYTEPYYTAGEKNSTGKKN